MQADAHRGKQTRCYDGLSIIACTSLLAGDFPALAGRRRPAVLPPRPTTQEDAECLRVVRRGAGGGSGGRLQREHTRARATLGKHAR